MSRFVYPRLSLPIAMARIDEIRAASASGGLLSVEALASVEHPRAAPVPTGGRLAIPDRIADVRAAILQTLEPWRVGGKVSRAQAAAFDLALGRTLHDRLEIVPADAAHEETWSFLALVVLPDIAVLRFPDMHDDRLIGTPRNALRRTWFRQEVLGDLLHSTERPLGEDELVGLFERTAVARNRALVRRLAVAVLAYDGTSARSVWARELYKRVTFSTGPRLLDALSDDELDALIRGAAGGDLTVSFAASDSHTGTDLEARFQQAMVDLYYRVKSELGYNASSLARTLEDEGGIATARRLVLSDHASEVFFYLWGHKRLDLTVEFLVVADPFRCLFDSDVIARAERRLQVFSTMQ